MQLPTLSFFLGLLATGSVANAKLSIPAAKGYTKLPKAQVVSGNFDGGMKEFDRGIKCGNGENGSGDAVFILENGASISNVIIGAKQREGIHCKAACTITNVWFRDVCEDAISLLGTGSVTISGGGAQNADDKVVQHNGRGTVTIKNFTVSKAGKVYRSCGNCTKNGGPRKVVITGLKATGVKEIVGINSNYGDTASVQGSCGGGTPCQEYIGVTKEKGGSSKKVSSKGACKVSCK
ncbi:uncharacterized protein L3040_001815 [Drepanopeziza brunnea f. sp. 'multigermtubi']|uniref:Pectate lyase n=1 Tax=Marssonina brunnea f. sp. multigermtubi (strain MB_m1) TaxID=1072389 RepID=K1WSP2_MARBU|nr:pectate lyase [Drepanopeziza brunnea f. sp. 'multigermtubi' MB_m1]EKD15442.1 pectate lyase [Drepanopeziza brunnea f. sp. 'multigermtubi' MB_m1]KAJ5052055.1 hypothetical protein L3040_001815 [Drepanopeziza brunnea f. sp. 'multigermtubi']